MLKCFNFKRELGGLETENLTEILNQTEGFPL